MSAIIPTLADSRARFIEDFRITTPDAFNGNNPTGDPDVDVDWWPAFARASVAGIDLTNTVLPYQRTYAPIVVVGRTRSEYRLSKRLDLFCQLRGAHNTPCLTFNNNTDGIVIHYPRTVNDTLIGTFNSAVYTIDPAMAPYEDYGATGVELHDIVVNGSFGAGTRGITIYRKCYMRNVTVSNFGWHGIHITADVNRNPGASNVNLAQFDNIIVTNNGSVPGTRADRVSSWNPTGLNGYGSGFRIQGGDANVITTRNVDGTVNAGPTIHDTGFLGNTHISPHNVTSDGLNGGWTLTATEEGIYAGALAWQTANPVGGTLWTNDRPEWDRLNGLANNDIAEFEYFDFSTGEDVFIAFNCDGLSARTTFLNPYVEGIGQNTAIFHIRAPTSKRIGGIGGRSTATTQWRDGGGSIGQFEMRPNTGTVDPTSTFADAPAPSITFGADAGELARLDPNIAGDVSAVRLKYISPYAGDFANGGPAFRGFFMIDSRNASSLRSMLIAGSNATVWGRTFREGAFMIPDRIYLGQTMVKVHQDGDVNSPTLPAVSGEYQPGDILVVTDNGASSNLLTGNTVIYVAVDDGAGNFSWEARA